MILCIKLCKSY